MLSFSDIIRGILALFIVGAVLFFAVTLVISLLPLILVAVVAFWLYSLFFSSPHRQRFYVYRRTTTTQRESEDSPHVKGKGGDPSKMIEVEAEVRDSK